MLFRMLRFQSTVVAASQTEDILLTKSHYNPETQVSRQTSWVSSSFVFHFGKVILMADLLSTIINTLSHFCLSNPP
jgi:hypothetical protein